MVRSRSAAGETDPSHIIRTIEYWDRERRRYPDIQHRAVIIAEEITGRFFNVISLFNQSIPIIALKLTAVKAGEHVGVMFTKVLDYESRGVETDDYDGSKGRSILLEQRSSQFSLKATEHLIEFCRESIDHSIEIKFNKPYIGTTVQERVSNFVTFVPQKKALKVSIHCADRLKRISSLKKSGIDWTYKGGSYPGYRLRLAQDEITDVEPLIKNLIVQAYKQQRR